MSPLVDRMSGYEKSPRCANSRGTTEGKFRVTELSNTPDPRIEAAAAAMWEQRPMMRTAEGSPLPWAEVPAWSYGARYRGQARVALAAADAVDPRTPRTIETAEELDALPIGSVVLDADGDPARKFAGGWRTMVAEADGSAWLSGCMEDPDFPATVLFTPEAAA